MAFHHLDPALAPGQELELTLHPVEVVEALGVERAVFEGGADRAAGFVFVPAVAEPALPGRRLDVLVRTLDVALVTPDLQLAARPGSPRGVSSAGGFP